MELLDALGYAGAAIDPAHWGEAWGIEPEVAARVLGSAADTRPGELLHAIRQLLGAG